jgi:hypothetical protein
MADFKVIVRGSGLEMVIDGETGRFGFRVNRFVSAPDPDSAIDEALRRVRADRRLQGRSGAELLVEAVEQLGPGQALPADTQGVAFYPEDESTGRR